MSRSKRLLGMTMLMMNEHRNQFPNDKIITAELVDEMNVYYEMMNDLSAPLVFKIAAANSLIEIVEELIPVMETVTANLQREKDQRNAR